MVEDITRDFSNVILIKFGEEEHLKLLQDNGDMKFSTPEVYQKIEIDNLIEGQGDKNEGVDIVNAKNSFSCSYLPNGEIIKSSKKKIQDGKLVIINEELLKIPVFCMSIIKKYDNKKKISKQINLTKIEKDFPKATHALIIKNPLEFLNNVLKIIPDAFCHEVMYSTDSKKNENYYDFVKNGTSDIDNENDFIQVQHCSIAMTSKNSYKELFVKDIKFKHQKEYRIVRKNSQITKSVIYKVGKINNTELVEIDKL